MRITLTVVTLTTLLFTISSCTKSKAPRLNAKSTDSYFKFHLLSEPSSYDPAHIRGVSGSYLFSNMYRSLYSYTEQNGLTPEGAKNCQWISKTKLDCELKAHYYSDGSQVFAKDYVYSLQRLFDKNIKSLQAENFIHLKNAKEILKGKKEKTELGIKSKGKDGLIFTLEQPDPDFLYKLTYPATTPLKHTETFKDPTQIISFGPYSIKTANKQNIILEKNTYYTKKSERPPVQIVYVDDHLTALTLYETKKLNFLRMMFTEQALRLKNEPGFFRSPLARFDYIGFGPRLKEKHKLRKKLTHSLDYDHLAKLLLADKPPGCPSLLPKLYDNSLCYEYNPDSIEKTKDKTRYSYQFSKANGDDILRQVEWMQHRWKKHIGLQVDIEPQEEKGFYQTLQNNPPDFFRKGLPLSRPTCLAALENFKSSHPDNLIKLNSKVFDKIVTELSSELNPAQQKKLCNTGISYLLDNNLIIPMGLISLSMIHDMQFENWNINSLNQLDLSELSRSKK